MIVTKYFIYDAEAKVLWISNTEYSCVLLSHDVVLKQFQYLKLIQLLYIIGIIRYKKDNTTFYHIFQENTNTWFKQYFIGNCPTVMNYTIDACIHKYLFNKSFVHIECAKFRTGQVFVWQIYNLHEKMKWTKM